MFFSDLYKKILQNPKNKIFGLVPINLISSLYNNIDYKFYELLEKYYYIIYNYEEKKYKNIFYKLLLSLSKKYLNHKNILWKNFLYKNVDKPIILDYKSTISSIRNLNKYFYSKGFLDSIIITKYDFKKNISNITYNISTGKPYFLDSLKLKFDENNLARFFYKNIKIKYLNSNNIFNEEDFNNEKNNISNIYKNYLYYNFNPLNDISFYLKSNFNTKKINTLLHIKQKKIYINGVKKYFFHKKYFIKNINLKIDTGNKNKNLYNEFYYNGYKLEILKNLNYNEKIIFDSITFKPKSIYSNKKIVSTKNNLNSLNNFFIKEFSIKETLTNINSSKGELDIYIHLVPLKKYNLNFYLESILPKYKNNYFIISPKINFLMKNIFNNGENLEFSLIGNYSYIKNYKSINKEYFNNIELLVSNKIFFPKFFFPLNFFIEKKNYHKSNIISKLIFNKSIDLIKFNFTNFIEFLWQKDYNKYKLKLFNFELRNENINYQNTFNKQKEFKEYIINNKKLKYNNFLKLLSKKNIYSEYILEKQKYYKKNFNNISYKNITKNYFNNSIKYNYEYNQTIDKNKKNPFVLSLDLETSGNIIFLLKNIIKKLSISDYNKFNNLFKYYQYLKLNLDIRKYWNYNNNISLYSRFFTGLSIPYGEYKNLPIESSYFCGGPNDIRSWYIYSLGPGTAKKNVNNISFADIKIISNIELKLKIIEDIFFSTFIDIGNIWDLIHKNNNDGKFYFNKFYKQFAIGGGFGIHYNLKFLILKLDMSYKIFDPAKKYKNYWNFYNMNNPIINFTIGDSF